ncbi:MAG: hypothetical protein ABL878_03055 [Burkholderiales bacterium]
MSPSLPPLLMTSSAIAMDRTVALIDTGYRVHFTLESIGKWIGLCPDLRIVLCDGSGYDFSGIVRKKFPGSQIECLLFENDKERVAFHGKGYGEGEIIKYALAHSAFLREADWFAKCTAKLWVDNFDSCLQEWNGYFLCKAFFANVFGFKRTHFEYVDTRFYMVTKEFYARYFAETHLMVGGHHGTSIEHNFKAIVLNNNLKKIMFKSPPVIRGVGGGSGKYYRNNRIRRLKESLRSRIVQSNPLFRDLFNRAD